MSLTVYISSMSGNTEMKAAQSQILNILEIEKVEHTKVEVSDIGIQKLREMTGDDKALAPQVFKGDTYLGGHKEFMEAVEDEKLKEFLKL